MLVHLDIGGGVAVLRGAVRRGGLSYQGLQLLGLGAVLRDPRVVPAGDVHGLHKGGVRNM